MQSTHFPLIEPFSDRISDEVQQNVMDLHNFTTKLVDEFWTMHYNVRNEQSRSDWGLLGLHIRQYTHVFGIEWYMNRYAVVNGRNRVFSKPLKYNKRFYRYSFTRVHKRLRPWEIDLVDKIEPQFIEVRKRLHYHTQLLRTLRYY